MSWWYWRIWLADRFGWTLDYVDSLALREAQGLIEACQSRDVAYAHEQRKALRHLH